MIQMIVFILSYTFDVHKIPERKNRNLGREDLQKPEKENRRIYKLFKNSY